MENQKWYDQLQDLESSAQATAQMVSEMKVVMQRLIDENQQLVIENAHLRERLDMFVEQSDGKVTHGMTNLEKLYQSGIHICHNFYGAKREEMCLLCESLLSQHQE